MRIDRQILLAVMAGTALYLVAGAAIESYHGLLDSLVLAELISRIIMIRTKS